jgi:hypothetical protein
MRILSWDVGIINLAYQIREIIGNENKIIKWDIINIIEQEEIKCNCNKRAVWYNENNNYCGLCKNSFIKNHNILSIDKKDYVKEKKCYYQNEEYQWNDLKKKLLNHNKEIKFKKLSIKNSKKYSIEEKKILLIEKLNQFPELLQVDYVIVENQPVFKNPHMKTIENTIVDYFIIRGIFEMKTIKFVKMFNASNKLKTNLIQTKLAIQNTTNKYKTHKLLSIQYTLKDLNEKYPQWLEHFNNQKKQDDLADTHLMIEYLINKNKNKVNKNCFQ